MTKTYCDSCDVEVRVPPIALGCRYYGSALTYRPICHVHLCDRCRDKLTALLKEFFHAHHVGDIDGIFTPTKI